MGKKETGRGLWGSPQRWVHFSCSHFKFKAFYMAAEWEAFQNLQEAGKESSITRSILTETEELANKHMWNIPLFVTTGGTVFPTNTLSIWKRTVTTCFCGYKPCCPGKESLKQAIPPPYTLRCSYFFFPFSAATLFLTDGIFLTLRPTNYSSVMQMGSFAGIKTYHEHEFYRTGPYISPLSPYNDFSPAKSLSV